MDNSLDVRALGPIGHLPVDEDAARDSLIVRALGPIGHLPVDEDAARDAQPPTFSALGGVSIDIDAITLAEGSHGTPEDGMCLLEAVAFIAGEPHSDHPQCVCPVLAAFGRAWNDGLTDEDRDRLLKPFIPRLIGTRATLAVERQRGYMVADWAVRVYAPVWLRAAGLEFAAAELEGLAPLNTVGSFAVARPVIARARAAARDAAMAAAPAGQHPTAAGTAAVAAALDAAGTAARSAAIAAAGYGYAAMVAADAAVAVGEDAAMAAAAAGSALRPHVEQLQVSAVDLYRRMIEVAA